MEISLCACVYDVPCACNMIPKHSRSKIFAYQHRIKNFITKSGVWIIYANLFLILMLMSLHICANTSTDGWHESNICKWHRNKRLCIAFSWCDFHVAYSVCGILMAACLATHNEVPKTKLSERINKTNNQST